MQSGANKTITVNVLVQGSNFTLVVNPKDTLLSLKKAIACMYYESNKYNKFADDALTTGLAERLVVYSANKGPRDDNKELRADRDSETIEKCGIGDNANLHVVMRLGAPTRNTIVCRTTDMEFKVHWDRRTYDTIGPFKEALSRLLGMTCTSMRVKRISTSPNMQQNDEHYELNDDNEQVPITAVIYATLDGKVKVANLSLRFGDEHNEMTTSDIKVINAKTDEADIRATFDITTNTISACKIWAIIGTMSGGGGILISQCIAPLLSVSMSRAPYTEVACLAILGSVVGAAIGGITSFIYERYFKSQDITPTQFNANYR